MESAEQHNNPDRRKFIATAGVAAAAVTALSQTQVALGKSTAPRDGVEWRNKQSGMAYRRFGRANIMVSEMVFGGLSIGLEEKKWKFLETGIEKGINYIDTASGYNKTESEQAVANVINTSSKRQQVYVATKASGWFGDARKPVYDKIWDTLDPRAQGRVRARIGAIIERREILDDYYLCNYGDWQVEQAETYLRDDVMEAMFGRQVSAEDRRGMVEKMITEVESSLKRLGTDHVDVLMAPHGCTAPEEVIIPEVLEAAAKLKKSGKIRFFGFTAHNEPAGALRAAANSEVHDMGMIAYNVSNAPWVEPALAEAGRKDLGVVAMKVARAPFPDRGGKVDALPGLEEKLHKLVTGDMHIAEKAYLWALQNPNLTCCVSAMFDDEKTLANCKLTGRRINLGKG